MRISKLPRVAATLLLAATLAFAATLAIAQGKSDDKSAGASVDPPQSRGPEKELPPLSLLPKPGEELESGEDDAPGALTCPDRGNNLELII
jgi:hypothetical protein